MGFSSFLLPYSKAVMGWRRSPKVVTDEGRPYLVLTIETRSQTDVKGEN